MSMVNSRAAGDEDETRFSDSTDRISELPQPLLHHILCFLPQKEAVQTCVLSKSWRCLGPTRPKLKFLQWDYFWNQTFLPTLDKILQVYHDQKLCIQEFHVEFRTTEDPKIIEFLENWFPFLVATMSGVKTFDLSFNLESSGDFALPPELFENSKSLRNLRLCRFRFSQIDKAHNLKHLQTLTLEHVHIVDDTFQNIMSSCRHIEHVFLDGCEGLTTIRLSNLSHLKRFHLINFQNRHEDLCLAHVPNLETVKIKKASVWFSFDRQRNMYFPGLKSLHLTSLRLPARPSLDILSRDFPSLQHFYIYQCSGFDQLRVSNYSIKHLTIILLSTSPYSKYDSTKVIAVDAPNLEVLDFSGSMPVETSFATTYNEYVSNIKPTVFMVSSEDGFLRLSKLLKAVNQSKIYLKLPYAQFYRYEDDDDDNGNKPAVPVEYLHLDYIVHEYFYSEAFLNRLFRYCRPRNILERDCTQSSIFLYKLLLQSQKGGIPYFDWQRDLEGVSVQVWDQKSQEWHSVEGTAFLESVAHEPSYVRKEQKHEVWFKLKWRELVRPSSHTIPMNSQSGMPRPLTAVSTKASQFLLYLLLHAKKFLFQK